MEFGQARWFRFSVFKMWKKGKVKYWYDNASHERHKIVAETLSRFEPDPILHDTIAYSFCDHATPKTTVSNSYLRGPATRGITNAVVGQSMQVAGFC
jgi:hypothetical protein